MKKLLSLFAALVMAVFGSSYAYAQEDNETGFEMTVGVENMSAYNWRGVRQSEKFLGYNAMPNICLDWYGKNLSIEAGIYDIEEVSKSEDRYMELGAWLYVSAFNFDLQFQTYGLDTYAWNKEAGYGAVYELGLTYTLPVFESFQPKLSWYTLLGGDDFFIDSALKEKRAFSSYAELVLPYSVTDSFEVSAILGANPFRAPYYCHYDKTFAISNIGLAAEYTFEFDNGISLPIKAEVGYNPVCREEFSDMWNENGIYAGITASFYFTKWLSK